MSNYLTRIKNNQITDSTILANTKIVPGSIVGSLFNSNLVMNSNVTITGNLTVQGSSTYLTLASTNTYVNDPLIVMNNAFTGTNTYDIGLLFNRGNDTNQALIWDETEDEFRFISTTELGTTYGNVVTSGYSNVRVGNLTVEGFANISGLELSGNIAADNLTLSDDLAVNGGDITTTALTFNFLTANATTVNAFLATTDLEFGATTGTLTINNPTVVGTQTTQNLYNTTATTVNFAGAATTVNIGAANGNTTINNDLTVDGTAKILSTAASTNPDTGSLVLEGGLGVEGNINLNGQYIGTPQTTFNLLNANVTTMNFAGAATTLNVGAGTGTLSLKNANISLPNATTLFTAQTSLDIANTNTTTVNAFGAATTLNLGADTGTATINNDTINLEGNVNVNKTTTSINPTTGALVVDGGVGVGGNINLAGTTLGTTSETFDLLAANALVVNFALDATTLNIGESTGTMELRNANIWLPNAFTVDGPIANIDIFNRATTITAFTAAANLTIGATTGTLTVRNPTVVGTQTTQNLYNTTATTINFGGDATTLNLGAATGVLTVQNANLHLRNATTLHASSSTFALLNTDTTTVNFAGAATSVNVGATTGTVSLRNANVALPNATTVYTGQTSLNFANTVTTTVNAFGAATTLNFAATTGNTTIRNNLITNGALTISSSAASTSTSTGALVLNGGIGIAGNAYVGENLVVTGNLTVQGDVTTLNTATLDVEDLNITVAKGAVDGVAANGAGLTVDGANATLLYTHSTTSWDLNKITRITSTQDSTNNATGALQVLGGVGIAESLYARDINATEIGNVSAAPGTFTNLTSTSTTTLGLTSAAAINNTPIGNLTASSGAFTTLTASNVVQFTDTTATTSVGTGALRVSGGTSISGNLYIGGDVNFVGSSYVLTGNFGVFYGDENGFGALYAGVTGYTALPSTVTQFTADINDYAQVNFENLNTGGEASTDMVLTAPTGDDISHYINMGITSVNWNTNQENSLKNALGPNDGYFYVQGNISNPNSGGNLVVGTSTPGHTVKVIVGGNTAANLVAVFNDTDTESSSTTTGALTLAGGLGVTGNIFANNISVTNSFEATDLTLSGDLAVNGGDITTTASTFNLLTSTATTVEAFTAAANLEIGATTGTLTVNNPTVVGTQTSQDLFNTTATTMNFAGAATTVNIGANTGTVELRNANIYLPNATTVYTGQTTVDLLDQNATTVNAFGAATTLNLGADTGNVSINNEIVVLPNATDIVVEETTVNIANTSATTINAFGAATALTVGATSGNTVVRNDLTTEGNLKVNVSTISTSTTTGALVVKGGVGLGANLNVDGGANFNVGQNNQSFRVYGQVDTTLIYVDSATDTVTIGGSDTAPYLGAKLQIIDTGAMILPVGSTSERPGLTGNLDVAGMLRFNATLNTLEFYDGDDWQTTDSDFTVIQSETFNGDGFTLVYNLSGNATTTSTIVSVNGIVQIPITSYSIDGSVLTFTEAPDIGDVIDVRRLTTTTTITELRYQFNVFRANATAVSIGTGTSSTTDRLVIGANGSITITNTAKIKDLVYDDTAINVPNAAAPVIVDSFALSAYTSAKYLVQVKEGSANVGMIEAILVHDGSDAYIQEGANVFSNGTMGTLTANVVASDVRVYYTSTSLDNSNVKVHSTYIV